ncbi:DUF4446 family protein [bacterium]|nr:DUF4446 family protein [bacterium]
MHVIVGFVKEYNAYLSIGLLVFSLILFGYMIVLSSRTSRLAKRKSVTLSGANAEELAEAISEQSALIYDLRNKMDEVHVRQMELGQAIEKCIQNTNIIRFNAFEDVGGEQSFALSLLDANNTGIIISSLYGRQDSRLYVKSVTNGEGERALSEEEQRAIGVRPKKTTVA